MADFYIFSQFLDLVNSLRAKIALAFVVVPVFSTVPGKSWINVNKCFQVY